MEAPDFWENAEKASADMKEVKDLKKKLTTYMTRVKEASNICTDCNK